MEINAEVFWTHKSGSEATEYEDAFYPEEPVRAGGPSFRFAVADGATESSFAGVWARLLVRGFVETMSAPNLATLVADLQQPWSDAVGQRTLPWYAQEKLKDGAFSSLLGLSLRAEDATNARPRWTATAVGDTCLVQVRDEATIALFPIERSIDFGSAPFLLPSVPRLNDQIVEHVRVSEGECLAGDTLYLMTDAVACWFMAEAEQGRAPWRVLRDLNTADQREPFGELIANLRAAGAMRNDDSTLMRIDIF